MCRRLLVSPAAVLLLFPTGCSTYEGATSESLPSSPSSPEATTAEDGPPPEPPDPLATTRVDGVAGPIEKLVRGTAGRTLVYVTSWRPGTTYRIYDREWRALTPALHVQTYWEGLSAQASAHGFLVRASRDRTRDAPGFRGWVQVDARGRLRRASPPPPLPGVDRRRDLVTELADGAVCVVPHRARTSDRLRSSLDGGGTWQLTTTVGVEGAGRRLWSCAVGGDRVVALTGGSEYAGQLHTYDRSTGALVGTIRAGDGTPIDPYAWWVLSDGTLVARTDRPGVVVATDTTNTAVTHHAGLAPGGWTTVLDDQIVQVRRDRQLAVSDDRGATWHLVDLRLPAPD